MRGRGDEKNLFDFAVQFIAEKYEGVYRAGVVVPYTTHLFGVARLLKSTGYRDEVVIAGLLHDCLEQSLVTESELRTYFGDEIVELVKSSTELEKTMAWDARKQEVLTKIQYKTDEQLAVTLAEKIHNVHAITAELAQFGEGIWQNFKAPKEKQEWYYRSIINEVKIYHPNAVLGEQLEVAVEKLFSRVKN